MNETPAQPARHRMTWVARQEDTDRLGHVSNIAYVRWIQDLAQDHSEAIGWDLARYRREGGVFVVRRHDVTYVQPAHAGERIEGWTWLERWRGARCVRRSEIRRADDGALLCHAATEWVLVDPATGRPRRIDGAFADAITRLGARQE